MPYIIILAKIFLLYCCAKCSEEYVLLNIVTKVAVWTEEENTIKWSEQRWHNALVCYIIINIFIRKLCVI